MSTEFIAGQRWFSDAEPDLGLGTVLEAEHRQVQVVFLATGEMRRYANETAPLTRVVFEVGDTVSSQDNWELQIVRLEDEAGLIHYHGKRLDTGETASLLETQLDHALQFRSPRERLFNGLVDGHRWFHLRRSVFEHRHRIAQSPVRGLAGARVAVLPHQIYIANEAVRREQPRLLLADEVGLGKTIEAGLVLHALLSRHLASRALVIVPTALLHQWLVEMLRKFNLRFHIIDHDRHQALLPDAPEGNPFLAEQLVLCPLEDLQQHAAMQSHVMAGEWDLLVVDEAHHLVPEATPAHQAEDAATTDTHELLSAYDLAAALCGTTPAVLLLTATPEQLGREGHFARLALLDPDRFQSLDQFIEEESNFSDIARTANNISQDAALDANAVAQLEHYLDEALDDTAREMLVAGKQDTAALQLREQLLDQLIDRHGTGRLMFRNTRHAIEGFPGRQLTVHTLRDDSTAAKAAWLKDFLADKYPERVLLICHAAETVDTLSEQLRLDGIASARFHEHMSIVERDRAAAWFADHEDDCRVLLCSEIGSEGRNFQFLHTLVTFDLPLSPDLLEQRIGRLDRIGQTHTVDIHVPVAPGSQDHARLLWFHEGLDAFESLNHGGSLVLEQLSAEQLKPLHTDAETDPASDPTAALDALIEATGKIKKATDLTLHEGRDRLLELHSNRPERIQEHLDYLSRLDRDYRLQDFMDAVFDRFGVDVNEQRDHWIVKPGDHMQVGEFPLLDAEGLSITFDRTTALEREDLTYLSWDHPMVHAAMDLIISEGRGQADIDVISVDTLPHSLVLVECSYFLQCQADAALNMQAWLPAKLLRFIVGADGRDYSRHFDELDIDASRQRHDRKSLKRLVLKNRDPLGKVVDHTRLLAERQLPAMVDTARASIEQHYSEERTRLEALAKVNPLVRPDEIERLAQRREAQLLALDNTQVFAVSIRVLLNLHNDH